MKGMEEKGESMPVLSFSGWYRHRASTSAGLASAYSTTDFVPKDVGLFEYASIEEPSSAHRVYAAFNHESVSSPGENH